MAGGLPTRRRSNSSSGAANPDAAASSNSSAAGSGAAGNTGSSRSSSRNPPASSAAASRPKRRARGLPASPSSGITAATASSSSRGAEEKVSAAARPSQVHSSSPIPSPARSSSSERSRSARASPRSSSSSASTSAKKQATLIAVTPTHGKIHVTLKIGGKWFVDTEQDGGKSLMPLAPSLATQRPRRQRSASTSSSKVKQEADSTRTTKSEPPKTAASSPTDKKAPAAGIPQTVLPLGHDGNTFYCSGCGEVGDVVCCDGCPRVYHRKCVPAGLSKTSLEQDDDPWFCPDCFLTKGKGKYGAAGEERTCFECNEMGVDLKQCESCEGWIHFPSCHPDDDFEDDDEDEEDSDDDSPRKRMPPVDPNRILCRICRVEELEESTSVASASPKSSRSRQIPKGSKVVASSKRKRDKADDNDNDDDDDENGNDEEDDEEEDESASKEDSPHEDEDENDENGDGDDGDKEEPEDDDDHEKEENETQTLDMDVDGASTTTPNGSPASGTSDSKKTKNKKTPVTKKKPAKKVIRKHRTKDGEKKESPKSSTGKSQPALSVKKRTRPSLPSSKVKANMELAAEISNPASSVATPGKKKKKEKKEKKESKIMEDKSSTDLPKSSSSSVRSLRGDEDDGNSIASSHAASVNGGYPKATPAFFFFLHETRQKIERLLARKHRIFNRLPKGYERNELAAKEGAIWWSKLSDIEVRRYMMMSMHEYEERIIEWKEEKNIRDMLLDEVEVEEEENVDVSIDDEVLTYENHQRLYLGTNVGSKPFKPEPETSRNRILLELLQDMRFHPMPMLTANRTEVEYGQMDFDRVTIPYFDVHGPFSTSVGDECMGCTRGWTHYCNVLKRRIPAVEHRAKLQPPLSTLMATRVGLGLRPRAPEMTEDESEETAKNLPLFATRDIPEVIAAKKLPMVAWDSLSDPSSRADDIVQFIEETIAMKVPEPPRPDFPNADSLRESLGGQASGQKRSYDTIGGYDDRNGSLNKCGRCRTVISSDTGCIPCRRAQLVINMSKRAGPGDQVAAAAKPTKSGDKGSIKSVAEAEEPVKENLKVQTLMCGRVNTKESSGDQNAAQSETDTAIANGILRQRWTPFTILPPHTLSSPTPKTKLQHRPPDRRTEETENGASKNQVIAAKADHPEDPNNSDQGDDMSHSSRSKEDGNMDIDDDNSSTSMPAKNAGTTRSTSKRLRNARMTTSQAEVEDDDRHELALRYKKEAEVLNKKCVGVACCGILLALMRRDPLLLFASPVTAEGYSTVIKNPMDFGKIRNNVLEDQYSTMGSFVADCRLLCTNALSYNPPGSIYWKTAKELYDILTVMQKRVSKWMNAIKDAHAMAWRRIPRNIKVPVTPDENIKTDDDRSTATTSADDTSTMNTPVLEDPFIELRQTWPEAVDMLEDSDWLRRCISADFMRTRENETAYYGALAVRRTAAAAEAALAAYPDSGGVYNPVSKRTHAEDEALRRAIDERVSEITHPVELKDLPSWREDAVVRVLRRAQGRRLDGISGSKTGCARCDGTLSDAELKRAKLLSQPASHMKGSSNTKRNKNNEVSRIDPSRMDLSTGMASQSMRDRLHNVVDRLNHEKEDLNEQAKAANEVAVSVRGSGIHGWGLFADQGFQKGDVVAEYIGEYVSLAVTEARETMYQEQRIQDYQFRLDDQLVIDATIRGGHGRYINHNCNPNCIAKIIPGALPNEHLKRVIIIAQRKIAPREELSYDYQFPLELDLEARIPCNCMSDQCRGFMNWDIPEKGSNNQVFRSQKRGANMRDRIRRLGRPLKSEKGDGDDGDDNNNDNSNNNNNGDEE